MSTPSISLNVYTKLEQNDEGELYGARNREIAFRSNQFTAQTSRPVRANMAELIAKAENPDDKSVQYDVPFMLPVILRKARPADPNAAHVDGIMQVNGKITKSTTVARAPANAPLDDDNPF